MNHLIGHDIPYLIDNSKPQSHSSHQPPWTPAAARCLFPPFLSFPCFVPILTLDPIFLNFSPTSPVIFIIHLRKYITPSAPPDPRRPSDRLTRSSPPVTRYRWPRSHPPSLWDAVLGFNLPALSASHHHHPPLGLCLPRLWSTIATISTLSLILLPFSAILHHFTAFPPFGHFFPGAPVYFFSCRSASSSSNFFLTKSSSLV